MDAGSGDDDKDGLTSEWGSETRRANEASFFSLNLSSNQAL